MHTEVLESPPVESVERMVLKFPRALFEEVINRMEERKFSPIMKKKKLKRRHLFNKLQKHRSLSPPPSPISFSSLSSLSFSSSSSPSSPSHSLSSSSAPSSPSLSSPSLFSSLSSLSSISSVPVEKEEPQQILPIVAPPIDILEAKEKEENRPSRESKKKFYELLSSVIQGDPCPDRFEHHVNQLNINKPKLLSKQQKRDIAQMMLRRRHFPAEIMTIEGKGTGVRTLRPLSRFQFICEYAGELITKTEAIRREKLYAATSTTRIMSCYMYYFEHRGQEYCIDATTENGAWGIGRLINHSIKGNLDTVKIVIDNVPRLAFVANQDINAGAELAYDYGDRTSFAAFPWLKK